MSETEHLHTTGDPRALDAEHHPCACVSRHMPMPAFTQEHHVIPKYLGGPENGRKVPLCATAHDNVHRKIREFDHAGQITPRGYMNAYQYDLAVEGWNGAKALGLVSGA